jgi:hypothetical protein
LRIVGQVESKGDAEEDERRNARAGGTRSIVELDGMLSELAESEE